MKNEGRLRIFDVGGSTDVFLEAEGNQNSFLEKTNTDTGIQQRVK